MKNLKVETSRDFGDRSPSKSFFRELSGQLTPKIADLIESEHLRESLPELICISLDSASYTEFTESDGSEFLNMRISAFSAPGNGGVENCAFPRIFHRRGLQPPRC